MAGDAFCGLSFASVTSGPKRFSDLFFNLSDAISPHTPLKYMVYFAKSSTNKNGTLKFPNELQVRNSSAEAGMENIMNSGPLS